jgi:hypothetical protein
MQKVTIELSQDELNCIISSLEGIKKFMEIMESDYFLTDIDEANIDFVDLDFLILKLKKI